MVARQDVERDLFAEPKQDWSFHLHAEVPMDSTVQGLSTMFTEQEGFGMEPSAEDYGEFCWCIRTTLSQDGKIFAHGDDARILPDGTLVLLRIREALQEINLSISAGNWQAIYAVHPREGTPFAIKRWAGEIDSGRAKTPIIKTKAKTQS